MLAVHGEIPEPTAVIHKGIEYSVAPTADAGVWQWRFRIGNRVTTGKTGTRLAGLAARRVQMKIDAALRLGPAPRT